MRKKSSIAVRLVLVITFFSALIFAVTLGYNYYYSREILENELKKNARDLAMSLVYRIETELVSVIRVTEGVARSLETGRFNEAELLDLIKTTLEKNPGIYGSGVAFEPYAFRSSYPLYAPYFYRKNGGIAFARIDAEYRFVPYLYWDWYQIPRELEKPEWSEPYFDEGGGNIPMTTFSVPFYTEQRGKKQIMGIITADLSLEWLTELVSSVRILETGYASILSRNGMLLAHPLTESVMNETFFSIAEARNDMRLRKLGKRMVRGESGFIRHTSLTGSKGWLYYAPIRYTGWTLTVFFPEREYLEDVTSLSFTMAIMGFIGILLLTAAVVSIARTITKPLRTLACSTHLLATGNFDLELPPVRSNDEVGILAHDFQAMKDSLKEYIRNLTETTAAKERIQSELNVAKDIQASLLPRIFPPFPNRPEFDIFASMDPAKEVGGDFYDFFFIDDKNLCFLIADVSGKGVPAALYMMVAKTLLRTEGQRLAEPEQILARVNNTLDEDNESCMFATVFCAILNTGTGEVRFANAGHNPPLVMDSGGIRYLALEAGFVLGPISDTMYKTERFFMQPGDVLFLYTDGVTEAMNPEEALYGELRLLHALERVSKDNIFEMIHYIRNEVKDFANGAPQSDDITMVAVAYRGASNRA